MAFNWNFKPKTLNGFNSAPVESLMPQAPGAIPTQMKGQGFSPDYNIQGLPQDTEDYQRAAYMDAYEADEAQKAQALQAQQVGQQKRITDIQNQIATLEKRIAENTAKLQNFSGNADQIAAIEARKINRQDPTSIWRWKAGMDFQKQSRKEDLARAEAEKQKSKEEQKQFVRNKISSTIPTMSIGWNTSPEQIQQFKNTLASLKTEAMNNKLSAEMNDILDMEAQLNGELPKQRAQIAMNKMKNAENLFNATKEDGGFGKDPKAYHNYLLQQFTQITRDYPEAAYDPAFIQAFEEADAKFKKQVKTPKVKAPGRK